MMTYLRDFDIQADDYGFDVGATKEANEERDGDSDSLRLK